MFIVMLVFGGLLVAISLLFFTKGASLLTTLGVKDAQDFVQTYGKLYLSLGILTLGLSFWLTKGTALLIVALALITSFLCSMAVMKSL